MNRIRCIATSVVVFALFIIALLPTAVSGLGFTGNFYRYGFIIEQGQSSAGIDAYVVVINPDQEPVQVRMKIESPDGVTITLPGKEFVLEPLGQKKLEVTVAVSSSVELGEYKLSISAESFREGTGVKVSGAGMQQATLTVVKPPLNMLPIIVGVVAGILLLVLIIVRLRRKR